ncbi:sugar-binding transcriptional regulator [Brucella intermedia]|uniref:sugar-binding transcriptional regulator n=1 Tax=Brucella intermedia TaxID=94625 RepID=UPI00128C2548|nr:sugar-binding domain-containing protein [Brucella intermedia]MCO7728933.1 sugar-binding transcriptional regulator [Brucella intermedia]MPR64424.1 sugar-binding transcriptional regulator [Brucella intermedia]
MSSHGDKGEVNGDRRLDLAARAAWLYYEKSKTQDQIAAELGVSRQVVQRLIALAQSERLIRFQLVHPMSECIELAERLMDRFSLQYCDVAMNEFGNIEDIPAVGLHAALYLETVLQQKAPLTIAIGNGKAMREVSRRLQPINRPQHKCVSLMGNLTRDGRASHYDVVTWLSERIGAQCFPLPMPVVTHSIEEREVLQAQPGYRNLKALVGEASLLMMGIGYWGPEASLYMDGFITAAETGQAMECGAIGELLGTAIDVNGRVVDADYHPRLTSFALTSPAERPTVIVGSGTNRAAAITAALAAKLANGLITDENTARRILDGV